MDRQRIVFVQQDMIQQHAAGQVGVGATLKVQMEQAVADAQHDVGEGGEGGQVRGENAHRAGSGGIQHGQPVPREALHQVFQGGVKR